MTTEELNALVERLERGEWENAVQQGPNPTWFSVDGTADARAAASAIRQLMSEREEAREVLIDFNDAREVSVRMEGPVLLSWNRSKLERANAKNEAFLSKHPPAQS